MSQRHLFPFVLFLSIALPAAVAGASPPPASPGNSTSAAPDAGSTALFSADDASYAASAVAVAASALSDQRAWESVQAAPGNEQRRLAQLASRLGDPVFVTPALLASYVAGRIAGLPGLASGSARVAVAVGAAGVADLGLKFAIGRARPADSPDDPWDFKPFHRTNAAFPSGHTTIAFAAASAIDAETSARLVPWVVYPAAAAVGWSRVVENEHWTSDVVAGAALGFWTGRKVDGLLRNRVHALDRATFLMRGSPRNFRVGFTTRF